MNRRAFLQAAAGAPLAAIHAGLDARPARRPNIILIMADDMGFSDLGCLADGSRFRALLRADLRRR